MIYIYIYFFYSSQFVLDLYPTSKKECIYTYRNEEKQTKNKLGSDKEMAVTFNAYCFELTFIF